MFQSRQNSPDCGVFMCMLARYLSSNNSFNFCQSDMEKTDRTGIAPAKTIVIVCVQNYNNLNSIKHLVKFLPLYYFNS